MLKRGLFLDRDGVVNIERNYVHLISEFEFVPGIFELCKSYQDRKFLLFIITNQAGISRGYYSEDDFQHLNQWMLHEFFLRGIQISKVYHCPHHPSTTGKCECRKPEPGMIFMARDEFGLDLARSVLIGDKLSDVQAGNNAGIGASHLLKTPNILTSDLLFG